MVNPRAMAQSLQKTEAKELLDSAKQLIDNKVLGDKFKKKI